MAQRHVAYSHVVTQRRTASRERGSDSAPSFQFKPHPTLNLQQILGNRQVTRLIQAKQITPDGQFLGIQRKLMVAAADGQCEQEAHCVARPVANTADAVATNAVQRVMSPGEGETLHAKPLAASISPFAQQHVSNNGKPQDQQKPVQGKSAGTLSGNVWEGGDFETRLNRSKGRGSPLPDPVRASMEPRFGADFSQVRVHTGREALQMNKAIGAQAFTHGRDIYFGAGHSPTELALTAHELTHVVQQEGTESTTRSSPVRGRTPGRLVQGDWKMTEVTHEKPVVGSSGRGNRSIQPLPLYMGFTGILRAWQEVLEFGGKHEGGNAQLMMRRVSRYRFLHEGDDNNVLTFHVGANIFGGAEADDLHYAEARAALVGNMAVRTRENPAPEHTSLFPPIDAGGKSEATKSNIGEVDAEIPVGDKTVNVHIPLTITDEGALAHISKSSTVDPSIKGEGKWKMVDVYLVAYMDAAADIETEFWGFFGWTGDVNWAHLTATYTLSTEEQKIPGKPASSPVQTEPGGDDTLEATGEGVSCRNPPGCSPDKCRDLQKEVKRLCDQRRACEEGMSCKVAETYVKRNNDCANARRRINDQCFNGGDSGHRKAENNARQAAAKCRDIIRKKKCEKKEKQKKQ